jgi:hypothetical protein
MYSSQEHLIIHLPQGDIEFRQKVGINIVDWDQHSNIFSTSVMYYDETETNPRNI